MIGGLIWSLANSLLLLRAVGLLRACLLVLSENLGRRALLALLRAQLTARFRRLQCRDCGLFEGRLAPPLILEGEGLAGTEGRLQWLQAVARVLQRADLALRQRRLEGRPQRLLVTARPLADYSL